MRYCLTCRHFSAAGPICNHCGRSFGGRLCNHKKRHLSPPDAKYCGQCGSTKLTDATSYIPLGCSLHVLILLAVVGVFFVGGGSVFTAITGYRSPLVWLIEKLAHVLILLFVFYFLSGLIPGEAGRQFRSLMTKLCTGVLGLVFKGVEAVAKALVRALTGSGAKP